MKRVNYLGIIVFLFSLFFVNSCKKDSPSNSISKVDLEINQFIWNGLNYYYLWKDSVPNLSWSKFQTSEKNLNAFLSTYTDHKNLFENLLYKRNTIDKWSWIVDDYTVLENELQGITKSMGFDFRLVRYGSGGTNVFGYVRYVLPNSPAGIAGLKRGNIFTKVDDQQITTSNYQTLLFNKDSYKLSFADIVNHSIYPNNKQVSLAAVELQENPVFLDTVYTINNMKIGYLVYNGFYPNFDVNLNNVFSKFKTANIQNLILDLRYNGGGSIQSAINLASMIYTTNTSQIFAKSRFNKTIEDQILADPRLGSNYFLDHFIDTLSRTSAGGSPTTICSLGLSQLFVITTGSTASASELVINGLKPYINVKTIGTTTVGKYVGSITVKDEDSKGNVNPDHKWALQPIILKLANANNESDYVGGFIPNITIDEMNYLDNLLPLGSINEPLLMSTLNFIQNLPQKSSELKSASIFQKVADSKDMNPHSKEMYKDTKFLK